MIHPDTCLVGIDPKIGVGVVASQPISAGTLIWVRDPLDLRLDANSLAQLPAPVRRQFVRHAYLDNNDQWQMCWDIARFINHHCDYNCVVTPWGVEIACRDIDAGEEISNDYALFRLSVEEEFDCLCGAKECRRHIDSRDIKQHQLEHEQKLALALSRVPAARQPLWPLLSPEQTFTLKEAAKNATSTIRTTGC